MHDKTARADVFHDGDEIDRAVEQAVREALKEHKRRKNPVAAWDGKAVVIVHPEDIPVEEPLESDD